VVNMPAKVLFASGKAKLSEEGRQAVGQVAQILKKVRDKQFIVAGHTDDQKIAKSVYPSNWDLSTARALVVTKALIRAGMDPARLSAAGFSQFDPIASNATKAGQQKNRRIEIVLEPYLKSLPGTKPRKKKKKIKKKQESSH